MIYRNTDIIAIAVTFKLLFLTPNNTGPATAPSAPPGDMPDPPAYDDVVKTSVCKMIHCNTDICFNHLQNAIIKYNTSHHITVNTGM